MDADSGNDDKCDLTSERVNEKANRDKTVE